MWEHLRTAVSQMKLNQLVVQVEGGSSANVAPVLRTQLNLTHLELFFGTTGMEDLTSTTILNLKSIKSTLIDAACIIPGRPVEAIALVRDPGMNDPEKSYAFYQKPFPLVQLPSSKPG